MASLVYFNGSLRQENEVALSMLDRSYLYGEGLFETMRATQGFIPFLQEHLDRLFRGMDLLQMQMDISGAKLEFALYQTLHHNHLKNAYLRLNLSRENKEVGSTEPSENLNLIVMARPFIKIPQRIYKEGCSAVFVNDFKITPDRLRQVKSTNYLRQLLAQKLAEEQGADEALMTNTAGHLVEGARANLFLRLNGKWVTPPLEEGILPGVTRQVVIDLMVKNRIEHEERALEFSDLQKAEEAFFTNAIREIFPLTRVDEKPIALGKVGEATQYLMQMFREEIQFRFEKFESRRWGVQEPK